MINTIKKELKYRSKIKIYVKSKNLFQSQKISDILYKNDFVFYSGSPPSLEVFNDIAVFFMCYDDSYYCSPYRITYSCKDDDLDYLDFTDFVYYEVLYKDFIKIKDDTLIKKNKQFVDQLFDFKF